MSPVPHMHRLGLHSAFNGDTYLGNCGRQVKYVRKGDVLFQNVSAKVFGFC